MEDIIYGKNSVLEALKSEIPLNKIYIARGIHFDNKFNEILKLAKEKSIPIKYVERSFIEKMVDGNSQGVLAILSSVPYKDWKELEKSLDNKSIIVVLDHIQDPYNLGAIARTSEFAGVSAIVIPKARSAGITSVSFKTSAGALSYIPVIRVSNIANFLRELKGKGWFIVGADLNTENLYNKVEYNFPLALVVGSEGEGLHRIVRESCDLLVKIPSYGKVESLNVSVAVGIILYKIRESL
ncbi:MULTISPECIES: 23S rRNA (guanosine(2251)-2'-O)-methyltransferase RlmB [Dictyoglomus]|jgi:23S rRNA (guanosine2251-2'-O)-methyltransferase|uniref:RNA methyltransferase, TrmH family, group 3 n=1 Tax=Dictyoglomus turgidum (strain DSM 6724 / Z-1310) TaxID=515635 RepID=B8E111_DICTD|nr:MULTISPECIES: 23S rRNA (guanosine(2251)-2'-O)-methyltransferase RlmB [Dictyoglomus]ACK42748.1 RNA methyltransferase, TrmH family, group 3 [Dictyoglomus turgidum DSM 6724]HBU30807.1 23S rRNA (guanosine(2251)-2'-O)-methyltransferase RlmB [Dictyoglomus sp.]